MEHQALLAIGIFLLTYAVIISEKIHRTVIAMVGGILMILLGVVDQQTAIQHVDFGTIGLLVGMMIIVNITGRTGVFKYLGIRAAKAVKGDPMRIFWALNLITAIASAFLDNVTTVLLMVPVTFSIVRRLALPPIPFLISLILSSNIGGTATMIGDPPNIMIGTAVKELTFVDFITNLAGISLIILVVTLGVLSLIYRKYLRADEDVRQQILELDEKAEITDITLLKKSVVVLLLTMLGFFLHPILHIESATIALSGATLLLLLTGERYLEEALAHVEWGTIFFFVGLFVLVSGLEVTGVITALAKQVISWTGNNIAGASLLILWVSAIASTFVDNIPFVATMIPLIKEMGSLGLTNLDPLWWSLSLGACLGGNGSLIGASANVIVAGMAAKEGQGITFLRFFLVGFPLMVLSIAIAHLYVFLRYL
ncbi:ArsB/NhaD family transporter [Kyrpidia tusciae]|uniref:Citrate transporter n=1 Tax=Kyrpidia tusciae (strain DSM 2912 / NBRC 15312 / T2) TaxID=562970 RepID=D5WSZ4_KYRT2|nr:ArsB/NhaD family transporter [Kyrpidia tusciae]ADG05098.1 Citrate transporter [Kyrpidia tusciae DSM 2912]